MILASALRSAAPLFIRHGKAVFVSSRVIALLLIAALMSPTWALAGPLTSLTPGHPSAEGSRAKAPEAAPAAPQLAVVPTSSLKTAGPQARGSAGREFWLAAPTIVSGGAMTVELDIMGEADTEGTVTVSGSDYTAAFSVGAGATATVEVPYSTIQFAAGGGAIHVTAGKEISVDVLEKGGGVTNSYAGLPVEALGFEYIALGRALSGAENEARLSVVATSDDTILAINPSFPTENHAAGESYSVTLNQGQTYRPNGSGSAQNDDATGTVISSNKPVAVFSGFKAASATGEGAENSEGFVQLSPTDTWGQNFVAVVPASHAAGDLLHILAAADETHVSINGVEAGELARGQFHEQVISGSALVVADKPVLVAQYAQQTPGAGGAAASMMLVPATAQFRQTYTVTTPAEGFAQNFVQLIVPASAVNDITLDGTPVQPFNFTPSGDGAYSIAQFEIRAGAHQFSSASAPFGANLYGSGEQGAYAYPAGLSFQTPDGGQMMLKGEAALTSAASFSVTSTSTSASTTSCADTTAVVRHAPAINGSVAGSVQLLSGEYVNFNSGSVITSDLMVPGTPGVQINGTPNYQGTIDGTGSAQPSDYQVTLNSGSRLRHLIRRTNPVAMPSVPVPPAPAGTRSVTVDSAGYNVGNWATVRDLTLNAGVGAVTVPPGTYNNFTANDHTALVFGVSGATVPSVYNLDTLTLNSNSGLQLLGPVVINLGSRMTVNSGVVAGASQNPRWLSVNVARYDLTVNSLGILYGTVNAPAGTVYVNGRLVGSTVSNNLSINSGGSLEWMGCPAPANQPPTVSAGQNQTITLPTTASLAGTASDDGLPAGSTLSVTWSKVTGPGTVTFANAAATATTATFGAAGTYVLRLTANDSQLTVTSDVTITVNAQNQAPAVNAGANQTITLPNSASLQGTASDDGLPTSGTLSTAWSKVSGPGTVTFTNPSATATAAAFSAAGTYVLRLTGSDSELTSTSDITVTVNPENHAPVANAGRDQTITLPAGASLSGTVTDDGNPTGSSVSGNWSLVTGPGNVSFANQSAPATTASFSQAGTYVLRLTASDSQLTASDDVTVTVKPQNQAPTANAGPNQTITLPNGANLNGTVNDDGLPGGTLASTWSVVSGPGAVAFGNPNVTVTGASFGAPGVYVLRLAANDSELTAFSDVTITVNPAPINQPPTVSAGPDQAITLPAQASLNGTVTDDGLPAGAAVSAAWSKVSGPGTVTFADPSQAATTATFGAPGVYVLQLTASDTELSNSSTVSVTVAAGAQPPVADFSVSNEIGVMPLQVVAASSSINGSRPENLLDDTNYTYWMTNSGQGADQFVKFRLADEQVRLVDRVRLVQRSYGAEETRLKDFEIQVSDRSDQDADFHAVFSGTLQRNTDQVQEFVFPGGMTRALYVKLVAKSNYGDPSSLDLGTIQLIAAGQADSIISLPGHVNAAHDDDPALVANGAVVVDSSTPPDSNNSPDHMLAYYYYSWSAPAQPNQYATIRLAGGKSYLLNGVRVAPWYDFGYGGATAVKEFEVWVSNTTADDSAFTRVLTASADLNDQIQSFIFPGGPVEARYVKYVPVSNYGGGAWINTLFFGVLTQNAAGIVATSHPYSSNRPAEAMLDKDPQTGWLSPSNVKTDLWVKIALEGNRIHQMYGANIVPANLAYAADGPRDFEIRVSTTTTDDAAFTTVYSGTLSPAMGTQNVLFDHLVAARYVEFYWKNGYGASYVGVNGLEVLTAPDDGSALISSSSQVGADNSALSAIDVDSINLPWITGYNQLTEQYLKLMLPGNDLHTISHISLTGGYTQEGGRPPQNFELQVSTTGWQDADYTTVLTGTLQNAGGPQHFYFTPTQARSVRLLLHDTYGGIYMALQTFNVYSGEAGGATVRFLDRSTDNGRIVSYRWDFGDQTASAERDPVHVYAAPGLYTVTLTVTDEAGLSAQHQKQYRVFGAPLVADFSMSPLTTHEGSDYLFLYDQSSPQFGSTAARYINFGDGSETYRFYGQTNHNYANSGTYQVTMTVGDNYGPKYTVTKPVTVLNLPPTVGIPAGRTLVWGETWTSTPGIYDPSPEDRASLQGVWNFGDGQSAQCVNCDATNATVTHAYERPGVYNASLTITDKDGASASASATYTVNKRRTSLALVDNQADAASGTYLMRARVTDTFINQPLAGKAVLFNLNGAVMTATMDASGLAEARFAFAPSTPITLGTATFPEDDLYLESGAAITNTIGPERPRNPTRASEGTDFWLAFPGNFNYTCYIFGCYVARPRVTLFITAPQATTGTVTIPGLGFSQSFSVQANAVTPVTLDDQVSLDSSDLVENRGIHVSAQSPVTVYGLNDVLFSADAYLALPSDAIGTEYVALGYKNGNNLQGTQFAVVAASDATTVTITPSITVGNRAAHVPYTVTLNQGQTYQLRSVEPGEAVDLSGSIISSDKPVALFGGHLSASVPNGVNYANHLVEQLPPVNTWGQYFVTMPLATRQKGDTFRFAAAQDATRVYVNGVRVATLNRGQVHEQIIDGSSLVVADKPILVAQYSNGNAYDGVNADPSMMIVPPYEQFGDHYTVTTSDNRFPVNYVNVVAPAGAVGSITLDGAAVESASFKPIGTSGFSGAQLAVGFGTHNLAGPQPFGVSVYGFATTDAYSYPGGMNLTPLTEAVNVALMPAAATRVVNSQACTVATVTGQNNNPLGGRQINFGVTGVNSTSGSATTDASGRAQFCYTSPNTGEDVVVATVGSASGSATVTWRSNVPNQAPVVNAGADQTITLPAVATLQGSVTDDGLPGDSLNLSWSKVTGPGTVTFDHPDQAATSATFDAAGVYVLRLTAGDSELTGSDEVTITVNPAPVNQPPTVNAGPDQTAALNTNLIVNPGAEQPLVNGEIPGWTEVVGNDWSEAQAGIGDFPESLQGDSYFYAGQTDAAELRQDVDVSAFAGGIAAGTQQFAFKAGVRSGNESVPDVGRVIVEYRDATSQNVIATLDSGPITSTDGWQLTEDTRVVPAGTGFIRIRLIATRQSGATNDAYFDELSLRPVGAAAVKLSGTATDDGLPVGGAQTIVWSKVSGPGAVVFTDANAPVSSATFTEPGTYVLRLTASDGALSSSDDVAVTVSQANQAPAVNAGADQSVTLSAAANLNGAVTDDGLPQGSSVSARWSKVSGPGAVTFDNANQAVTTATFGAAGTYVLRLTASDADYETRDEVTITVNAETNQPPAVNAGADQTITLPTDTVTLNGTATDDGLPAGSTLTIAWSKTSGPGAVTFGTPASAVTTAQFAAAGTYVLRLTATDSETTAFDEVVVTVGEQNHAPTVNAGADQTISKSQEANLNGTVSDDGLPQGSSVSTTWSKVSGPGTVTFADAGVTVTTATFGEEGIYVLRLTATDSELSASDDLVVKVDPAQDKPTVEILSPTDGAEVTSPADVVGTVSNGAWKLEYALNTDDGAVTQAWTTIGTGAGAVSNARLGTLDPTLMLNGGYALRLSSTDQYGQTSAILSSIVVARNLKVGQFTVSFSDLQVPVAGLPIEVTRTYDSRDKRTGDFGAGWTLGIKNVRVEKSGVLGQGWYETASSAFIPTYCLQPTRAHRVTITFGDGKVYKFEASTAKQCQQAAPISATNLTFTPVAPTHGTLVSVTPTEVQVAGSIPGPVDLVGLSNPDIYNTGLFRLTVEDGTVYTIDQHLGVRSVADPYGNTLTIDANGITHSSGKSITFTRDAAGRITQITDPGGKTQTYTYDANGDLTTYKDRENNVVSYGYTGNHYLASITDPRGLQPIRNEYDESGRLLTQTDAFGKVINYDHDLADRVETVTDRLGHPTRYEYDERGNVLRQVDAKGGVKSFTYDDHDNRLTETNALGKTTTYTYDEQDNRTSVTDALGNVTRYTYNGVRQPLTVTDALGHVTTNTYDAQGNNVVTTKDAQNHETKYTYSLFTGERTSMTDALNNFTGYDYDHGNITKVVDAYGNETTYTYGAGGNRTSETVTRTNAQGLVETITTTYEYDALNRLVKTTYPDGTFTQVGYNSIGQQGATIDEQGHRTTYDYDEMGRLVKTTYPDGTKKESTYDAEGHRLTSKDRAGRITTYTYDELGRLIKTTYPDNTATSTTYDAAGQVLTTTDALGHVTRYEYDAAGRRTKVTNILDQVTTFTYDSNGNQLTMTDAGQHKTTYEYDELNRRTKVKYADGTSETTAYDVIGRGVSKTDQAGKTTQFEYDKLGRLVKVTDALNQVTQYGYNELGQQTSQTDANNHTTKYEYDKLGRRVKRTLPIGQAESYAYDTAGNLQSRTDFNGKTTTYSYDNMGRLLSKTPDASLGQSPVTYTYNILGQRETMTDASGTTTYTYDAHNRLKTKVTPEGMLTYTYDNAGNLLTTRSSNPNGVSVDYAYNELNRLSTVMDNHLPVGANQTTYSYDSVGNLQSYLYPNGVQTTYAYNSLNRLTDLTSNRGATQLASYAYTLGAAGNRLSVTEQNGRTVTYTYDSLYRLTNEAVTNDLNAANNGAVEYSYDAVGNRLSRTSALSNVPSATSTYDANDRLESNQYDANGNTKGSNGNTYSFDWENHLQSINNGSVSYIYDGDGNRVAKTVSGVTTRYLVDTNNPTGYAQVVDELTSSQVTRTYTYGHDLISENQIINDQWQVSYYGYDGHGSTRFLTDGTGSITDTYTYDAFGTLISVTGTTPNEFLYTGERFDAEIGMYYLRARYMQPQTGRFWSMDSFEGSQGEPSSLHKYLYVDADPANKIDPSGNTGYVDQAEVIQDMGILDTMPVGQLQATYSSFPLAAEAEMAVAETGVGLSQLAASGLAFTISLGVGIGINALTKLKQKEKSNGYYYKTLYRWIDKEKEYEFRIGGEEQKNDPDGYLSAWDNFGNAGRYLIPMLVRFKEGDRYHGQLIIPAFGTDEVRAMYDELLDDVADPGWNKHYALEFYGRSMPYGNGDQGDIPGRMLDYAIQAKQKYGLKRGQLYNPWAGLTD